MDPLLLGGIVAIATILVLFSGVSVGLGLLIDCVRRDALSRTDA
jgi:hypothetical protein